MQNVVINMHEKFHYNRSRNYGVLGDRTSDKVMGWALNIAAAHSVWSVYIDITCQRADCQQVAVAGCIGADSVTNDRYRMSAWSDAVCQPVYHVYRDLCRDTPTHTQLKLPTRLTTDTYDALQSQSTDQLI